MKYLKLFELNNSTYDNSYEKIIKYILEDNGLELKPGWKEYFLKYENILLESGEYYYPLALYIIDLYRNEHLDFNIEEILDTIPLKNVKNYLREDDINDSSFTGEKKQIYDWFISTLDDDLIDHFYEGFEELLKSADLDKLKDVISL